MGPGFESPKQQVEISSGSGIPIEERYRLPIDAVADYAIFMLDPSGHVATWNSGAQKIKGYSANEIVGRHFSIFYTPEDLAAGKPDRELAVATLQGRIEDEGWRVRRDGSRFWANVLISAVKFVITSFKSFGSSAMIIRACFRSTISFSRECPVTGMKGVEDRGTAWQA